MKILKKSFCVRVDCDEEDDRLALHKSPVKGRLFCGILLKFCGDKERGASSHVWLRGVFDPEQVVSGTRPALNFPPRRLYLQSGGMCIGWVDQGRFPNPHYVSSKLENLTLVDQARTFQNILKMHILRFQSLRIYRSLESKY